MSDRLTWHLCWQAAYGHSFLAQPALSSWIRERLLDAHRRRDRVLIDFILLPCEIHTLSRLTAVDGPEGLSREIGSIVARRMRRDGPILGPALRGRYLAHWVESEEDLRIDMRMFAWRPVLSGHCRAPSHHVHGALRVALGISGPLGFDARPLLEVFGSPVSHARESLRKWVARRPTPQQMDHWELTRGLSSADACMVRLAARARGIQGDAAARLIAESGGGIQGALSLLESWAKGRLGEEVGGSVLRPGPVRRTGVRMRALVACLAVDHQLCAAAVVARHFGRAKSTLSEQMVACRARPHEALLLETPVQQIVAEVLGSAARRDLR
ncbi:hypothetical protein [Piscinibacter sakaiensis]|uniref:hypothetical protein n=1 Tax=Piscinibacter sakaiensis TaxID=1547922 RepID=UPI003AAFBA9A